MGTPIVVTGDTAVFPANCFPGALTDEMSMPLVGSGKAKVAGKAVCIVGDEQNIQVPCSYKTLAMTTPGAGVMTIEKLETAQQSQVARSSAAALLATAKFTAKLEVKTPASLVTPAGTQTDPLASYAGQGEFKTSNAHASASK